MNTSATNNNESRNSPEDLLRQLDGRVVLRSGEIVEVERAGKKPSDKIKLNIKRD
jgi:hypothetical protein